jgi:hypothetical protein
VLIAGGTVILKQIDVQVTPGVLFSLVVAPAVTDAIGQFEVWRIWLVLSNGDDLEFEVGLGEITPNQFPDFQISSRDLTYDKLTDAIGNILSARAELSIKVVSDAEGAKVMFTVRIEDGFEASRIETMEQKLNRLIQIP